MAIEITRTSVHCDERWHAFYKSIVSPSRDNAMEAPFATMYQAFFTFACLGKYHDTYVPISQKDRQEIFLAQYFDRERHVPILVSLAYDRLVAEGAEPMEAFKTSTTSNGFVPVVEGWANGGVGIFKDELEKGNPSPTLALAMLVMQEAKQLL